MERYRIGLPKDNVINKETFIADIIMPLCIHEVDRNIYTILFVATELCTESNRYIQIMMKANDSNDIKFLNNHHLNLNNIQNDPNRLSFYIDMVKDMNPKDIYATDFNMVEYTEKKLYYKTIGGRVEDEKQNAGIINLLLTRDNFIKINLFFNRIMNYDITAEAVFTNKKFNNIEFITVDHVKVDANSTDSASNIVCTHYTCGRGPSIFKFNYITPKMYNYKLKTPLLPDLYNTFYSEHFIVNDLIYDPNKDCVIILYEIRSEINNIYKATKALVFNKAFYNKTNFLRLENIYEEGKIKEEENDLNEEN